jgi:hypothetical protein
MTRSAAAQGTAGLVLQFRNVSANDRLQKWPMWHWPLNGLQAQVAGEGRGLAVELHVGLEPPLGPRLRGRAGN